MMNYYSSDSNSNNSDFNNNLGMAFIANIPSVYFMPRRLEGIHDQHEEDYSFMMESAAIEKEESYAFHPYEVVDGMISEVEKRRRLDSVSSADMVTRFSYIDTSFDDLAMAVEANSPDIVDGKPFNFEGNFHAANSKFRLRWTEDMDKLLLEAVKIYSEIGIGMWKRVAEYVQKHLKDPVCDESGAVVSTMITNHQCGERYKHHLDPSIKERKNGPWMAEEIDLLRELVNKYQTVASGYTQSGRTKSHINWMKISNELNRNYRDCQHKWATVSKSSLKAGTFTKEEEEFILRRVEELGSREPGIWNILENEMGRKARSIQDKFNRLIRKRKSLIEDVPLI